MAHVHRRYEPYLRLTRPHPQLGMVLAVLSAVFEVGSLAALGHSATGHYDSVRSALPLTASIAGALMCVGVTRAMSDRQYSLLQVDLERQLRSRITDAILSARWEDFVNQPGHELQSAAVSEAPAVAQAAAIHERARSAVAGAGVVFLATFVVSPLTAFITLAFGGVIFSSYRMSSRGLGVVQSRLADSNAGLTRHTGILVTGLRSLRLSPVQAAWRARMAGLYDAHMSARQADLLIPVRSRLVVDLLVGAMMFVVLLSQVLLGKSLVSGIIVMALILRVVPRVQGAQQMSAYARHGVHWIDRWEERFVGLAEPATAPRDVERSDVIPDNAPVLSVTGLTFRYRSHERSVLTDVSFTIARGEWVALRGESGGGKSTLIDIVAGLLTPTAGRVQLLGRDISAYPAEERYELLVVVPQDVQLLGETVQDIVTWNGLRENVLDARIAITAMGVDEMFLFSKIDPEADVDVDEMSRNISGGMRTRLAMARALAGHPALLILDETTSRLHPSAESDIFAALRRARPDLAVLVVTHRHETSSLADRTLTLSDGRLHDAIARGVT